MFLISCILWREGSSDYVIASVWEVPTFTKTFSLLIPGHLCGWEISFRQWVTWQGSVIMYHLVWEALKCWSSPRLWIELGSGPKCYSDFISSQRGVVAHHYQKEIFSFTTVFKNTFFPKSVSSKKSLRSLNHFSSFQTKGSLIFIYFVLSQSPDLQTLPPLKKTQTLKNPHIHTCSAPFFLLLIKWILLTQCSNWGCFSEQEKWSKCQLI